MPLGRGGAVIADRHRQEVILDVGIGDPGRGPDEPKGLKLVGRPEPGLEEQPFRPIRALAKAEMAVEGDRLQAGNLEIDLKMILKIGPDTVPFCQRRDTGGLQHRPRSDAGALQDCRQLIAPADSTTSAPARLRGAPTTMMGHTNGAAAVEQDPLDHRAGHQPHIAALHRRLQMEAFAADQRRPSIPSCRRTRSSWRWPL